MPSTLLYPSLCWRDPETGYRVRIPFMRQCLFEQLQRSYLANFGKYFCKKHMTYIFPEGRKKVMVQKYLYPLKSAGLDCAESNALKSCLWGNLAPQYPIFRPSSEAFVSGGIFCPKKHGCYRVKFLHRNDLGKRPEKKPDFF